MFNLKVDDKVPHHYIIGVAVKSMLSSNPGKMFLKYGPVYFKNEDVEHILDSLNLLDDKIYTEIYKMKPDDIYKMMGCSELIMSLIGLSIAAKTNDTTLHHFSCESPIDDVDNFFEGYVDRANKFDKEIKGLKDARIKRH